MSHFKLVFSTKATDIIPVKKYVSEKTGLTVIIANVEGPLVNGFFFLATEAHDDDGLPHTLEHLTFLGSKKYPYKGILDLMANRCLSQGTNAWTDTDHTCYTISTAGDVGMLTLLPIYLDHILHPTLTDEGFVTEVHHIDGDGDDAGVVYCEMQSRENSADSRCYLKLLRAMYPNSGYASETGGIMENLRTSTNNTKIRDFHKKFYRPENLTVILTGQISAKDVFGALKEVEDDIIEKRKSEPPTEWVKPWTEVPPSPQFGVLKEQWPADTEDCGQIHLGWRGPVLQGPGAPLALVGCGVLLRYLCETATAPLQRCLVQLEDALAGDVSYTMIENRASTLKIDLDNVPVAKLEKALEVTKQCLAKLRSGEEKINMERMTTLVKKWQRESLAMLETDPHRAIAFMCIAGELYAHDEEDFISRLNPQHNLSQLLKEPADYWLRLLRTYFSEDLIAVVGSPSVDMQTKMIEEEKQRIELQKKKLGKEGLEEKARVLEKAMEFNERPPPAGTMSRVPVPPCAFRGSRVTGWTATDSPAERHGFDLRKIPIYTRAHNLSTNFVYINLMLDTSEVKPWVRKWLTLLLGAIGECAIRRNGSLVPHETVIAELQTLTVSLDASVGLNASGSFRTGQFNDLVHVEIQCEPESYESVVDLFYEVLYECEITKERLLVFAQRLINEVSNVRREAARVASSTLRESLYNKDTNTYWSSVPRQHNFLKELVDRLNSSEADVVVKEAMDAMREVTRKVWLHIATDFDKFKLSTDPWIKYGRVNEVAPTVPSVRADWSRMSWCGGGAVVGCGAEESNFLELSASGPASHSPSDTAALLLAMNYFTQLEGPMWRLIRGAGLSYSYSLSTLPHEARVRFSLYRATNVVAAYTKAKNIVEECLAQGEFEEDLFISAKSATIFEAVQQEMSTASVVKQTLLNYLMGVGPDYTSEMVCALLSVDVPNALSSAQKWVAPLMGGGGCARAVVVTHPAKVQQLRDALHGLNIPLKAYECWEDLCRDE